MTSIPNERRPPSCLLLGYTGFCNTGAEVRIITIIEDIRACFGEEVPITVATPVPEKTARILPRRANVRLAPFPLLFPLAVFRLVARHDITFLVEGSTFQQNWSPTLLYFFLWGAWCARLLGKRAVAYAVDAGPLSRVNRFLTRRVCEGLDLVITRTERARQRLADVGVRRPIVANTDTAFTFLLGEAGRTAPAPARRRVGLAPIEFHQWPVRLRLVGPSDECFRWPYYYTWTDERRRRSRAVADAWAVLIEECVRRHDLDVVLVAMEELDARVCGEILDRVDPGLRPRIQTAYATDLTPYEMVPLLRGLDYLVTSRYHACVLSMAAAVPQMAVGHDHRLASIYEELGLADDFLVDYRRPDFAGTLCATFARLVDEGADVARRLRHAHEAHFLPKCRQNRLDLVAWARSERWARAFAPTGAGQ